MGLGTKLTLAVLSLGCAATLSAAEILKPTELKDFIKNSALSFENGVFVCKGRATLYSAKMFAVDPSKKYKLSGQFRAAPGTAPTILYFGYAPYDSKKASIQSVMVCHLPKTETELVKAAKAGDTVLKVRDASKWNTKTPYRAVVFNTKPDLSDLPNYTFIVISEGKIENKNDSWEITLKSPLKKEYPKGTKVRQHTYSGSFIYNACGGKKTSADWQTFSGVISGESKNGQNYKQWWPGTKFARILILSNLGNVKGLLSTEFKNITLDTID